MVDMSGELAELRATVFVEIVANVFWVNKFKCIQESYPMCSFEIYHESGFYNMGRSIRSTYLLLYECGRVIRVKMFNFIKAEEKTHIKSLIGNFTWRRALFFTLKDDWHLKRARRRFRFHFFFLLFFLLTQASRVRLASPMILIFQILN